MTRGEDWGYRLSSRKFLIAVGVMALINGHYFVGNIDPLSMLMLCSAVGIGYGISEGIADAGRGRS